MPCYECDFIRADLDREKQVTAALQSQLRIIKRVIQETPFESPENMSNLNLDEATRLLVMEALERSGGNRNLAASMLGCARSTLFMYLKKFGLESSPSVLRRRKRL